MSIPDVSVVMSVYNGADLLSETLKSVLDQSGCAFEFIVVNDGSTDASGRILGQWAARDDRLRVVHQQNTGLTRALVTGCLMAQGRFIARQDAGDISLPGRLQKQSALLGGNPELAFVSCVTQYIGPDGEYLYTHGGSGAGKQPIKILDISKPHGVTDGPSHHGSVMFNRDKYAEAGGYRPEFHFGQDWDLWYRLGALGDFQTLDEVLYQARLGLGDISLSHKELQEQLAGLSLQCMKLRMTGQSDAVPLQIANAIRPSVSRGRRPGQVADACYFLGECLRRNGEVEKARCYFMRALREKPASLKTWIRLAQMALK